MLFMSCWKKRTKNIKMLYLSAEIYVLKCVFLVILIILVWYNQVCVFFSFFVCLSSLIFFFELTLSVFRSYWFEFWFYTKSKMVEINWSQNEFWSLNKICKYDRGTRVCCHIHRRPFYQANHGILCTNHHVWSIFVKMVLCVRVCFLPFVSCTTNLWLIKQATSCSNQRTKAFFHVCIHFVCQT